MSQDTNSALEQENLKSLARELEREVKHLKDMLAKKASTHSQKIALLEENIANLESNSRQIKTIADIPGRRTPKWYTVDIDFDYNATATKFDSVQITAEGPFICTQIQPYYLVLDNDVDHYQYPGPTAAADPIPATATPLAYGRYLPCTAHAVLGSNIVSVGQYAAIGAPGDYKGALRDFPEFSFKIEIGGSGVFWTQDKTVPAAAFYGTKEPLYLGIEGYAERTDRIIVHANPETPIPLTGRVRMVFHGFQIAGDINISDLLGY